jgi:hypothetical protein
MVILMGLQLFIAAEILIPPDLLALKEVAYQAYWTIHLQNPHLFYKLLE